MAFVPCRVAVARSARRLASPTDGGYAVNTWCSPATEWAGLQRAARSVALATCTHPPRHVTQRRLDKYSKVTSPRSCDPMTPTASPWQRAHSLGACECAKIAACVGTTPREHHCCPCAPPLLPKGNAAWRRLARQTLLLSPNFGTSGCCQDLFASFFIPSRL